MNLSKKSAWKSLILLLALFVASVSGACRVRQTEEGEVPDVDVSVEGGKVPEYDVDAADVDVSTEKREVTVPKVEVEPPRDGDQDPPAEQMRPQFHPRAFGLSRIRSAGGDLPRPFPFFPPCPSPGCKPRGSLVK